MAGITLAEARQLVWDLLDDDTGQHWDYDNVKRWLNVSQKYVWAEAMRSDENRLGTTATITYPADTESITLSSASYLNAVPEAILLIAETPNSGAISRGNSPWEWKQVQSMSEIRRLQWGWGGSTAYYTNEHQRFYYMAGDSLLVGPIPNSESYLHITYVPKVTDLSSDSDELLNGLLEEHGEAVVFRAAYLMNAKQNGSNPMVAELMQQAMDKLHGSKRLRQAPRRVRTR